MTENMKIPWHQPDFSRKMPNTTGFYCGIYSLSLHLSASASAFLITPFLHDFINSKMLSSKRPITIKIIPITGYHRKILHGWLLRVTE